MKNFKHFALAAVAMLATVSASAEGYNRIGVSYNNNHFGFNKWMKAGFGDLIDGISLNGAGVSYIHGFGLSESLPMFIETGINFNFGAGTGDLGLYYNDYYGINMSAKVKAQNINLQVPVNFVYRLAVNEDFAISPFAGLNFKFNVMTRLKLEVSADGETDDTDWYSLFSGDDMDEFFGDDGTGNRFQMGWHIGAGFQYKPLYLGISYGTDFIAAYSHKFYGKSAKVSTGNLTVSLGYSF